jgi:arylsulfatase A-like enzyme
MRLLVLSLLTVLILSARPNFVVIFADDLGYGDLGSFGHPTIATPNLDRLAVEGQRWTNFYAAASVCTPSRAGLLTGRHPLRNGTMSPVARVFSERSLSGMPPDEITVAELLRDAGYRTAMVGKWHLGHEPPYLPTRQGFDEYFGLVSSNDHNKTYGRDKGRGPAFNPIQGLWDIPLLDGEQVVEKPAVQATLTRRYTERAIDFINRGGDKPFFLYLAHTFPHTPLFRHPDFERKSLRGIYGDVVEEIDWSVGRIIAALEENDLADETVVLFTSDNGPWLVFNDHGGSAGLLRGGKGSTWEGGMRVPAIFWGPGIVRPGAVRGMGSTLDVLPTLAALAEIRPPDGRPLDGHDLSGVLRGHRESPRHEMFFYRSAKLFAARVGDFKLHFITRDGYGQPEPEVHDAPLLFNLLHDPSEKYDIAAHHAEVVRRVRARAEQYDTELVRAEDQVAKKINGPIGIFLHGPAP